jgi:hypothetical protein
MPSLRRNRQRASSGGWGSSKKTLNKASVNITWEVQEEERRQQVEKKGRSGEAAVSS